MRRAVRETRRAWARFWLGLGGQSPAGRCAMSLAAIGCGPYYARHELPRLRPDAYFIDPGADLKHNALTLAPGVCLDDRVTIFRGPEGGPVTLHERARVMRGAVLQTGYGGSITLGVNTNIQPYCILGAYEGSITLGKDVQIAAHVGMYAYNHGFAPDRPIIEQHMSSKAGVIVEDDAWVGFGAVLLDGAHVGAGSVIGANSVVNGRIPPRSIAVGAPARVVKSRDDLPASDQAQLASLTKGARPA